MLRLSNVMPIKRVSGSAQTTVVRVLMACEVLPGMRMTGVSEQAVYH